MSAHARRLLSFLSLALVVLVAGCEMPPMESVQRGYRGLGMVEIFNPATTAQLERDNQVPVALPPAPDGTPAAKTVFKNLQVFGDLSVAELTRQMLAISTWVAPKQGCPYCHVNGDLASDALYTKVVARQMIKMTRHVNADGKNHVANTGVTCYTCHRGQPVPANIWFLDTGPKTADGPAGDRAGQNAPAMSVGLTSLPFDPFTPFLAQANDIRVISTTALPSGDHQSIKQTEWTYGLMMHISGALGVNCTYCHNTRSFAAWDASTPQRAVAWHAIRTVRDINTNYIEPLKATLPKERLGPNGDVPKVNCTTCHQGVFKPLFGAPMAKDYPALTPPPTPPAGEVKAAVAGDVLAKVLFESGKKDLGNEAVQAIAQAVASMKQNAALTVDLSGFADKTGSADKNLQLAKDRAFVVRGALASGGIAENRIRMKKPEFVIGGAEADARRVDIVAAK